MRLKYSLLAVFSIFLLWISCAERVLPPEEDDEFFQLQPIIVPTFGTASNLEVVSWNIQNFPKAGDLSIDLVSQIILDLRADVYLLQEIADTSAFKKLLNGLQAYHGIYSPDINPNGGYQKTAIIYRQYRTSISNPKIIFTGSENFPRKPMQLYLETRINNVKFDLHLIILHLYGRNSVTGRDLRRNAVDELKMYLDNELNSNIDKDFLVAGDWNDNLFAVEGYNIFAPILNDSLRYRFLTLDIARDFISNATVISGSNLRVDDHILVSNSLFTKYLPGSVKTIKVDEYVDNYVQLISDHRPVGIKFPIEE